MVLVRTFDVPAAGSLCTSVTWPGPMHLGTLGTGVTCGGIYDLLKLPQQRRTPARRHIPARFPPHPLARKFRRDRRMDLLIPGQRGRLQCPASALVGSDSVTDSQRWATRLEKPDTG